MKWPFITLSNSHLCNQVAGDSVRSSCRGTTHGQHGSPSSWALRLSTAPVQALPRPVESLPLSFVQMDSTLSPGRSHLPGVHHLWPFVWLS